MQKIILTLDVFFFFFGPVMNFDVAASHAETVSNKTMPQNYYGIKSKINLAAAYSKASLCKYTSKSRLRPSLLSLSLLS